MKKSLDKEVAFLIRLQKRHQPGAFRQTLDEMYEDDLITKEAYDLMTKGIGPMKPVAANKVRTSRIVAKEALGKTVATKRRTPRARTEDPCRSGGSSDPCRQSPPVRYDGCSGGGGGRNC